MEKEGKILISKIFGYFWTVFFVIQFIKDLTTGISWVPVGSIFVRYYDRRINPSDYWMGLHLHIAMAILGVLLLWIFVYKQKFVFLGNTIYIVRFFEILFFSTFVFFYLFSFIPL